MERSQFEHIKTDVAAATAGQILELEDVIQRVVSRRCIEMALARRTRQTLQTRICPHCNGNNIVLTRAGADGAGSGAGPWLAPRDDPAWV